MASDSLSPDGRLDTLALLAITTIIGITIYNALELFLIIYATFKRRSSLYFCPRRSTHRPRLPRAWPFGWVCMVTGQSLVLYSRLHLVCHNDALLRMVRNMIIFNAFALHIPTIVLSFGKDFANEDGRFNFPMVLFEKIQLSGFFLQEDIISGIYIWETVKLLRVRGSVRSGEKRRSRKMLVHLALVNVAVVMLDVTILVLECVGLHDVQRAYKLFAYSIKLKVEFSILNQLVELTTGRAERASFSEISEWQTGAQGPHMYVGTTTTTTSRDLEGRQGRDSGVSEVRSVMSRDDRDAQISRG
ncbi:hypothetical protein B0T14DRAFT_568133 [Immersiella caudata]|uniref:DUF7703 domain-containing protein n=1 Tax=Immersiella caudata TaxID=314043 RepID=A0AA40BWR5_9PEZI|nr:hypothetical protein B0T14DRAFT_568133 [Immersiella caudata]